MSNRQGGHSAIEIEALVQLGQEIEVERKRKGKREKRDRDRVRKRREIGLLVSK